MLYFTYPTTNLYLLFLLVKKYLTLSPKLKQENLKLAPVGITGQTYQLPSQEISLPGLQWLQRRLPA
jgi:hypothetical protein